MTVCVAALSDNAQYVVAAADRMLTAGSRDIEFEPSESKIRVLTNSLAVMTAGDSGIQAEIVQLVGAAVAGHLATDIKTWVKVSEVAEMYRTAYNIVRLRRSAQAVLSPLGLTHEQFLQSQASLRDSFVADIAARIFDFNDLGVAALVVGVDLQGAHIYQIGNDGQYTCLDTAGFGAIGIGARHALSRLMEARHGPSKELPEALLNAYFAKRRAEIAPGVGGSTDLLLVGPNVGTLNSVDPASPLQTKLEAAYQQAIQAEQLANDGAREHIKEFLTPPSDKSRKQEPPPSPPA